MIGSDCWVVNPRCCTKSDAMVGSERYMESVGRWAVNFAWHMRSGGW